MAHSGQRRDLGHAEQELSDTVSESSVSQRSSVASQGAKVAQERSVKAQKRPTFNRRGSTARGADALRSGPDLKPIRRIELSRTAPMHESVVNEALKVLGPFEAAELFSPMQLGTIISAATERQPKERNKPPTLQEAAMLLSPVELESLLSPYQREALLEMTGNTEKSTMLCDTFFYQGENDGSMAATVKGAPLIPRICWKGKVGRGENKEGQVSSRSSSAASSYSGSMESGSRSRESSLSWISDEEGKSRDKGRDSRYDPDQWEGNTLDGRGHGIVISSNTALQSAPAKVPPSGVKYASYRQVPTWEEMAESATKRTLAHQGPNKEPYWSRSRSNPPVASASIPDPPPKDPTGNAINYQTTGSSPSNMTLFEKVEAAQKMRRMAKEPALVAQKMRQNPQESVKELHAALAEYQSAFHEGNSLPNSVKKKIAAASSSRPNLKMTPTPCRSRSQTKVHTPSGHWKADEDRHNGLSGGGPGLSRTNDVYRRRAERAKQQSDAARRAGTIMDEERILAGGASARELELVGHFGGLQWKSLTPVHK